MLLTHTLEEAVEAQGWVGGQIEHMALQSPSEETIYPEFLRRWQIVDKTMDELIQENQELRSRIASASTYLR